MPLLSHLFTNQTIVDVFLYFLLNPQKDAPLTNIVNATGKALIQVQRTLKRLVEAGLVLKISRNKKISYKADRSHIAYEDLRQLMLKAKIFSETFKNDIASFKDKVDCGFIYGSVAKGSNTVESDIDIFLVGNLTYEDVGPFIFHLSSEIAQEVNVTIFPLQKLLQEKENKNSFVDAVLKGPKIWLFGDKYEFEKIYR